LYNIFAGINYSDYFDNQKYSDEYSKGNKIFISISAGCAVRLFNDPLLDTYMEHKDDFESQGYEKTDIMTIFMVDAGAQRLFWNVYDSNRDIYSRMKRNKAIKPIVENMFVLIIDGHETTASYKRRCGE